MGTTTIAKHDFDFGRVQININNNKKLTGQQKAVLLARLSELSDKKRTILQGAVFILNHKIFAYYLNNVLEVLNRENGDASLGMVEVYLQKLIDVICRMKVDDKIGFTLEKKSLCLRASQAMIDALSTYKVKNGVNNYMPKYWQEKAQAQALAASKGLDWNHFEESMYSDEYYVANDPKWKFFDREKMKQSIDDMMHEKTTGREMIKENKKPKLPDELYMNFNELTGMVRIVDTTDVTKTSIEKVNRIVVDAMNKFNIDNLRDHVPEFFNFVKGEIRKQDENNNDIDTKTFHDTVFAVMHRLVEIGNDMQMKTALAKSVAQNTEGRNL